MKTKNYIKILTSSTEVEVNDSENLITLDPDVSVSLEFTETEGYTDEEINNIQWIANMFHGRPQNSNFHHSLKGPKAKFRVPAVYSGGGLGWVEPVIPGHDPQFKAPFGYFINAIGKRSIDKVEWRDIHGGELSGSKFFTEAVQLHIYTTGLYGHEIQVNLYDKDTFFDDQLEQDEAANKDNLAYYFNREVKVLKNEGDDTSKVQKVVIDVRLEKRWAKSSGESTIELIPEINCEAYKEVKKLFENNVLEVKTPDTDEAQTVNNATKSGNKPVIIGDIVTDVAEFHPCKIKKVTADYFKGSSTQNTDGGQDNTTLEIFNEETSSKEEVIEIDVVAGPRVARREIVFKLDKEAKDCVFLGKEKDHNKTIVSVNAPIIIDSKIEPKKYRWDDSFVTNDLGKWFGFGTSYNKGNFEKEDLNHKDQNDNRVLEDSHSTSTSGAFQSVIGFKREHQEAHEVTVKTYTDVIEDDSSFTVEVPYVYGSNAVNENLSDIIKCFLPLKAPKQVYPVKFESCRGEKTVNINVYPDVKWTLQLAYNTDPEEFNKVREKYKEYKVAKQGLKTEKNKLDLEEAVSEDLIEKYERLADGVKANKGTTAEKKKKKAQKQRYKELAQENREKLKEVKKKKKNRKASKKQLKEGVKNDLARKKNARFYNFDNDPDSSYSDLVLSLWAEWDEYGEMFEVTGSYQKYANMVRQFLAVKDFVESIFGGKAKKRNKAGKKVAKRADRHEKKDLAQEAARIAKALKGRDVFSMNIIPPSLAMGASWYGEIPKGSPEDGLGLMIEAYVIADPIFGIEIVADFLALLQKVIWFRPFITFIDVVESIEMTAELSVTGKLHAQGMLQYNSASGETNFNPGQLEPDAEDDSPFKIGGTIELALTFGLVLKKDYKLYGIGSVSGAFEATGEIKSGFTIEGILEATKAEGFYMIPKMTFHGVKATLLVQGKVSAENDRGLEVFSTQKALINEEFVFLDEYENVWQNEEGEDLKWDLF